MAKEIFTSAMCVRVHEIVHQMRCPSGTFIHYDSFLTSEFSPSLETATCFSPNSPLVKQLHRLCWVYPYDNWCQSQKALSHKDPITRDPVVQPHRLPSTLQHPMHHRSIHLRKVSKSFKSFLLATEKEYKHPDTVRKLQKLSVWILSNKVHMSWIEE